MLSFSAHAHTFFLQWANSTNIVSIFETLCNDIQACEEAISDIKDLLRTRARQLGQGEEDQSWKAEWVDEVQALCERDSGWGWKGFWEMVEWGVEVCGSSRSR